MRLLVVSDTHGNYPLLLKIVMEAGHIDSVVHLGDGEEEMELIAEATDAEIVRIAGNCDPHSNAPGEILLEREGKRLFFLHGDRYRVKLGLGNLEQIAREIEADAVFYGHTHIASDVMLSGIRFINPGTLKKDSECQSYAIADVSENGINVNILKA